MVEYDWKLGQPGMLGFRMSAPDSLGAGVVSHVLLGPTCVAGLLMGDSKPPRMHLPSHHYCVVLSIPLGIHDISAGLDMSSLGKTFSFLMKTTASC